MTGQAIWLQYFVHRLMATLPDLEILSEENSKHPYILGNQRDRMSCKIGFSTGLKPNAVSVEG